MPSAVVLLSGGLDSTTALAIARSRGFDCYALTVRYGQLHEVELEASRRVAARAQVKEHRVIDIDLAQLAHSALTGAGSVPKDRSLAEIGAEGDVPSTYVPARNTVLLALALAWAESLGARDLFVGVNVLDASGYPDCRPEFVRAFEALANVATRAGGFTVHAPLIELTKAQIIELGTRLGVEYGETHSCYDPIEGAACGRCDACLLRKKGFAEAGIAGSDAVLSSRVKLGTLLLRNAAIGLSQLEAALRNQVLYGGRLGTNLVELGYLDLEALSAYLAELTGLPIATPTLLDDADKGLLDKLGADDAHRLRAIPLGPMSEAVAVAMVDPGDAIALETLHAKLGAPVTPYVVPELRALYYLERHFGTPRRARFIRTARAGTDPGELVGDERRRSQPHGGIAMPPTLTLEPRRRRTSSQVPLTHAVPTALSYGAACERIDTATNREQIADTFVDYGKGRCDALVVFLIREGNANGWRGYVAPPTRPGKPFEELTLPLGGISALQTAHDSALTYLGPSPSPARPIESSLWAALGAEPAPLEVLVVPVLVKQRPVNLIYAHTLGGTPPQTLVTELQDLAARAQTAYLRLIRQTRGS